MSKRITAADLRRKTEVRKAIRNGIIFAVVVSLLCLLYYRAITSQKALDNITLCPETPVSLTVLLVDVTDPMNVAQRQDFLNQLDRVATQLPRYGKLVITKVDPISDRLLTPVITRCNPGSAADVTSFDGNPELVNKLRRENFLKPLEEAFQTLISESGGAHSPILESIQSVSLTELQKAEYESLPKRLIVVSDLLQHTPEISFYNKIPSPQIFIQSSVFTRKRTDLKSTTVELWMLQREDSKRTQPPELRKLWEEIIYEQKGNLSRLYNVSG